MVYVDFGLDTVHFFIVAAMELWFGFLLKIVVNTEVFVTSEQFLPRAKAFPAPQNIFLLLSFQNIYLYILISIIFLFRIFIYLFII